MTSKTRAVEPNLEIAKTWWTDLPYQWTPVGWKNHMFRFNVFYNGMIIVRPFDRSGNIQDTVQYDAEGVPVITTRAQKGKFKEPDVQLLFTPRVDAGAGAIKNWWETYSIKKMAPRDDRLVRQGWQKKPAPILWSEFPRNGLLLRQEVLAHIPGGADVVSGIEPLFAWIRLSVAYACPGLSLDPYAGFVIQFNSAPPNRFSGGEWGMGTAFRHFDPMAPYAGGLRADRDRYDARKGFRLLEADGRVRLGIPAGQSCAASFKAGTKDEKNFQGLYIRMDAVAGRHVDVVLPAVPLPANVFDAELGAGYRRVRRETDRYWSRGVSRKARVDLPEKPVSEAIRRNLQMSVVTAEHHPVTGHDALLLASLNYDLIYPVAGSEQFSWLLDGMGYHADVDRYLELYRRTQGTVTPPSPWLKPHPGYLGAPATYNGVNWLGDHGALLWAISRHYLLTDDRKFLERWLEPIVRACDFIKEALANRDHPEIPGLMPPAVATDWRTPIQSVWTDGWNYKGLTMAVRVLQAARHVRAGEFMDAAHCYRDVFVRAFRAKTRTMPVWRDSRGRCHRSMPMALSREARDLPPFLALDAGALFLVVAGMFPASDPLMKSCLLWFREGPQLRMARHDSSFSQVPFLDHEMSSFEPCFSWNVFHSWQTGDRLKYLEGLYSLLVGTLSRQTYTGCETREGVKGLPAVMALPFHLARLAVVDDEIQENELHLLRLVPLAWIRADEETTFERLPTEFGPVTIRWRLSRDGRTLKIAWIPAFRETPRRVCLHVPPMAGLKTIELNGKKTTATCREQEL